MLYNNIAVSRVLVLVSKKLLLGYQYLVNLASTGKELRFMAKGSSSGSVSFSARNSFLSFEEVEANNRQILRTQYWKRDSREP